MMIQAGHRLAVLDGVTRLHFGLHAAAANQGFVLVPMPMRDTPDAMVAHLRDTDADVVVTATQHAALAEQIHGDRPALMLDENSEPISHLEGKLRAPHTDPDTYAILRTSGTSQAPKLIHVSRRALGAHRKAAMARLQCDAKSTWLASLPLWHIGGITLIDRCLHGGGQVVLQDLPGAAATAAAFRAHPITHVSLVPTMLHRLLQDETPPPHSLRCALIGGDHLDGGLAKRALDAGWPIYASYGLTEACGQVTTATPDEVKAYPGTSGRPLEGVTVTIVAEDNEAAEGEVGEIVVDGPTLNVPGPLHTGDLGRMVDGRLYVRGRVDDRIISGGENVDPAVVEAVLCQHPDVRDAAVVGLPDPEWGQRVVAAVMAEGEPDLEAFARGRLAAHERPKDIRFVTALPRTGNGKLQRAAVRRDLFGAPPAGQSTSNGA